MSRNDQGGDAVQFYRSFLVVSLWEVAMTGAVSFSGAWLWSIRTHVTGIMLYYLLWFGTMTVIFAWGTHARKTPNPIRLQTSGIAMAMAYLAAFLMLASWIRVLIWLIAMMVGLASGLYWLAVYVRAAQATYNHERYNAWLGMIETGAAVVIPPVVGAVIVASPGLRGYRLTFLGAFILLAVALSLTLSQASSARDGDAKAERRAGTTWLLSRPQLPFVGLGLLGFRDGMLFFMPGLWLFMLTQNAAVLGWYLTCQAIVQTVMFAASASRWRLPLWAALSAGIIAGGILLRWHTTSGIFVYGILNAFGYPAYKVPLEGRALSVIQEWSTDAQERIRWTSLKEFWLNGGRLAAFVLLFLILAFGASPLPTIRWLLIGWGGVSFALYYSIRRIGESQSVLGGVNT